MSAAGVHLDLVVPIRIEDIVANRPGARCRVLRIDTMTVMSIRAVPAVVVDQIAVHLDVRGVLPERDTLPAVANRHVDEPDADARPRLLSVVNALLRAIQVGWVWPGLRGRATGRGTGDVESPEPCVRPPDGQQDRDVGAASVERGAFAGVLPNDDRRRRRADQAAIVNAVIDPAAQPDRVPRMNGRGLV
jgi:hypothetical protein